MEVFRCTVCAVPATSPGVILMGFEIHDSWVATLGWDLPVRAMPVPVYRYIVNGVTILNGINGTLIYRYIDKPNFGRSVLGCIEADFGN